MYLVGTGVLGGESCFTSQLQSRNRTAERRLRLLLRDPGVKGLCSCIKCVGRLYLKYELRGAVLFERPHHCKFQGLPGKMILFENSSV